MKRVILDATAEGGGFKFDAFFEWLRADTFLLPECAAPHYAQTPKNGAFCNESDDFACNTEESEAFEVRFPRMQHNIQLLESAIEALPSKACVFRVAGRTARDASWIAHENSLLCRSAYDVLMLAKASDRIRQAVDACEVSTPLCISLIEWMPSWSNSCQFRIFVKSCFGVQKKAVFCQKDCTVHWAFLVRDRTLIGNFLREKAPRMQPNCAACSTAADAWIYFDVYADWNAGRIDAISDRCISLEAAAANLLLYADEAALEAATDGELRVVECEGDAFLGFVSSNRLPADFSGEHAAQLPAEILSLFTAQQSAL